MDTIFLKNKRDVDDDDDDDKGISDLREVLKAVRTYGLLSEVWSTDIKNFALLINVK